MRKRIVYFSHPDRALQHKLHIENLNVFVLFQTRKENTKRKREPSHKLRISALALALQDDRLQIPPLEEVPRTMEEAAFLLETQKTPSFKCIVKKTWL